MGRANGHGRRPGGPLRPPAQLMTSKTAISLPE
jgi:hypothetical protein